METTDLFSARAVVLGLIILGLIGAGGTVWLYLSGNGADAKDFALTIGTVSAPVAALARISRTPPVAETAPDVPTVDLNGPDPAVGH